MNILKLALVVVGDLFLLVAKQRTSGFQVYTCVYNIYLYIYTIIHMCNIRMNCTYSVHTVIVMIYIFERQVSKVWAQNIEVQVIQFQKYV